MKLSVSCPSCGKTFRNIKPEMAGKKARCSCGTVVRLGPRESKLPESKLPESKRNPRDQQSEDLLEVDLLGDEMLGNQLLEGDFNEPDASPLIPKSTAPTKPTSKEKKPAVSSKKRDKSTSAKNKPARLIEGPAENAQPEIALDPSGQMAIPNSKSATPGAKSIRTGRTSSSKSKDRGTPAPEVPLTVSVSRSARKRKSKQPVFEQMYGDLDDILSGAGDASPLIAPPQADDSSKLISGSRNGTGASDHQSADQIGRAHV